MAEIEARAGFGQRYLGQLLRGQITLKLEHVYALLAALGIEPMEFWSAVHGVSPQAQQPFAILIPQAQLTAARKGDDRQDEPLDSRIARQVRDEVRAALAAQAAKKPRKRRPAAKKGPHG
jgi:hypothetical protein